MDEFTPGPWEVVRHAWDVCSVVSPDGRTIAKLEAWHADLGEEDVDERAMHDARLIAAVPLLLEVVRERARERTGGLCCQGFKPPMTEADCSRCGPIVRARDALELAGVKP